MSDEIYHLQVQGERRGPYTLRQIDHQLNAGIISEDSQFVREGMDDWAPVTNLVVLRRPKRRWKSRGLLLVFACFLLVMAHFFGPIVFEGWREMAQFQYTEKAAYWRARDAVRNQQPAAHPVVRFEEFHAARVTLDPAQSVAHVRLGGDVMGEGGHLRGKAWNVDMAFDHTAKQWTATGVKSVGE